MPLAASVADDFFFHIIHSFCSVLRMMRQSRVKKDSHFPLTVNVLRCDYDTRKKFRRNLMHTKSDRSQEFRAIWQQQQTKHIIWYGDAQYVKNSKTPERVSMRINGRHNGWWQSARVCVWEWGVEGDATIFRGETDLHDGMRTMRDFILYWIQRFESRRKFTRKLLSADNQNGEKGKLCDARRRNYILFSAERHAYHRIVNV